ncbi:MAG TPA: UPF0158 family protein [Xanthobacteraceae bacterium]|nr:UPF0158 family protein [Xanthobacteraceae bacterium]
MPASFREICEAFELVSMTGGSGEQEAYLCKQTGKIYWHSDLADPDDELYEKLPDDIEDDEKYIAIPDKRELDLGKPLVLDFAREFLPKDFDDVRRMFSKKGGYRKFRTLLERRRALDRWYEFESQATERALRDWCEVNSITLTAGE